MSDGMPAMGDAPTREDGERADINVGGPLSSPTTTPVTHTGIADELAEALRDLMPIRSAPHMFNGDYVEEKKRRLENAEKVLARYATHSAPAQSLVEATSELLKVMQWVLCDPEGEPVFKGSDGDRKAIQQAMARTSAVLAAHQEAIKPAAEGVLKRIYERAGSYAGCRCGTDECGPGDCWPCRMMDIADMAAEGLQNTGGNHQSTEAER